VFVLRQGYCWCQHSCGSPNFVLCLYKPYTSPRYVWGLNYLDLYQQCIQILYCHWNQGNGLWHKLAAQLPVKQGQARSTTAERNCLLSVHNCKAKPTPSPKQLLMRNHLAWSKPCLYQSCCLASAQTEQHNHLLITEKNMRHATG